jgi:transposase-like protein
MAQEALLDDPSILKEILERVIQELLEAEITEHIGAAPCEQAENRTGRPLGGTLEVGRVVESLGRGNTGGCLT